MKFLKGVLLVALFMLTTESIAQFIDHSIRTSPVPPSPNASSILKFVDAPTNNHTGTASISIPIYEIKGKDLTLPISISYSSGGLKIDETPSWIGMGWSLSATGVVGRTIMDLPDEYAAGYFSNASKSYFDQYGMPITDSCYAYVQGQFDYLYYAALNPAETGEGIDTEPDVFSYSLPGGGSGKFVFDQNMQIRQIPKKPVKIRAIATSGNLNDRYFQLWDSRGTFYEFEAEETVTNSTVCTNLSGSQQQFGTAPVSSWYISKMQSSQSKELIQFAYTAETTNKYSMNHQRALLYSTAGGTPHETDLNFNCNVTTTYYGQRLTEISFGDILITFIPDTRLDVVGGSRLKEVIVRSNADTLKRIVFYHSYLNNTQFLMLDSLVEIGTDGTRMPAYKFEYEPVNSYMPVKGSYDQDHWGFFNAAGNEHLVPTYQIPAMGLNFLGANREPNYNAAKVGMLIKTTYPTGGYSVYEYEPHSYSNFVDEYEWTPASATIITTTANPIVNGKHTNYYEFTISEPTYIEVMSVTSCEGMVADCGIEITGPSYQAIQNESVGTFRLLEAGTYRLYGYLPTINSPLSFVSATISWKVRGNQIYEKNGGGLRIKSISSFDGISINPVSTKRLEYKQTNGVSSGKLMSQLLYHYDITFGDGYVCSTGACCTEEKQVTHRVLKGSNLLQSSSSPVSYDRVIEYYTDLQNNSNGKTVTYYSNNVDIPGAAYPATPTISNAHQNGILLNQEVYNNSNQLLRTSTSSIKSTNDSHIIRGFQAVRAVNDGCIVCNFIFNSYAYVSVAVEVDSTTEVSYENGLALVKSTKTEFVTIPETAFDDSFLIPRKTKTLDSNNKLWIVENKYPYDFSATNTVMSGMKSANIFIPVWQVLLDDNNKVYDGRITSYTNTSVYLPVKVFDFNQSQPIDYSLIAGINDPASPNAYFEEKVTYTYNSNADLIAITKPNHPSVALLWEGRSTFGSRYLVAEINNTETDRVFHASFEFSLLSGSSAQYTAFSGKRYRNSGAFNFSTDAGFTPANTTGLKMSYWYWNNNQWNFSGIIDFNNVINKGTRLDEIRVFPEGALMSTYTYNPGVGVTSTNDVNNNITYYEYDEFNRPKLLRDGQGNILKTFTYHYRGKGIINLGL